MRSNGGFTLVELSIVITIIALVMSGIFVAKNMIEAAETRAVATEYNVYTAAFKEFIDKYQAIPGDMNNAETYWQSDDSCPATASNTTVKTATCNGEGNGMIGDWTNTTTATADSEYEWFRAWQHLANALLIEGMFTGVSGSGSSQEAKIGVNVPASRSGKGGWTLLYMISDGTGSDTAFFNSAVASHVLVYGAETSSSMTDTAIINPVNARQIDRKIDDGLPFSGNVRVKKSATACVTGTDYLLTSTTPSCQFLFLLGL